LAAVFETKPTTAFKASPEKPREDLMTVRWNNGYTGPEFRVNQDGHVTMWGAPLWVWFVFTFCMSVSASIFFVWLLWG
jgi:hypothetical protein